MEVRYLASPGWHILMMLGVSALLIVLGFMLVFPAIVLSVDQVLIALSTNVPGK